MAELWEAWGRGTSCAHVKARPLFAGPEVGAEMLRERLSDGSFFSGEQETGSLGSGQGGVRCSDHSLMCPATGTSGSQSLLWQICRAACPTVRGTEHPAP